MTMKALGLLRRGFEHGVHPSHHKEQTADLPIQRVPFGTHYVMPLGQHIGVPAKPVVEAGERVRRGQMIVAKACRTLERDTLAFLVESSECLFISKTLGVS